MLKPNTPWFLLPLLLSVSTLSAQLESHEGTLNSIKHEQSVPPHEASLPGEEDTLRTLKTTTTFDVPWCSVDGGGATTSSGGDFKLGGTIGQPDAGVMSAGAFSLRGGFWAVVETDVLLVIPEEIPVAEGEVAEVPINFESAGFDISAAAFSIDFDESCLAFDATDADTDGIPDSISFSLPGDFVTTVTYDGSDIDGELDFSIVDPLTPLAILPDGNLATITFATLCQPIDNPVVAAVAFFDMPPPTFGNTVGQDVPGRGVDGSVAILPGTRGDCNADDQVSAGDLSACVLEMFDGDGACWLDVAGGTFEGSPIGCDANADELVNAGDLSCKILLIFEGPGACAGSGFRRTGWGKPVLAIGSSRPGDRQDLKPSADRVSVPVSLRSSGWAINSVVFSLDYDEKAVAFDPTDTDRDGIPDAIRLDLSASAQATVSFDRSDTDGEIDVSIFDPYQVLDRGTGEPLLTLTLKPLTLAKTGEARVSFSKDPSASFGDLSGQSVEGSTSDSRQQ